MAINTRPSKPLNVFSLVMINIIAVDSLRSLPIGAKYGFSLIFYYLLASVIFFIPVALVSAELATSWPKTGGIYIWVREAFGKKAAFITIWLQWIYNVVWYPTILAFLASAIAYLISDNLAQNKMYLFSILITVFWLATILNFFGMRISSLISALGALLGTLLPMFIIIMLAFYWVILGQPIAIQADIKHLIPNFHSINDLTLFTGILFGLVGMEMSAVHASDVQNPQKDFPRALLFSTIIIFASLVLSSLAVALIIPETRLNLITGLIDAFRVFFHSYGQDWLTPVIIGLMILGGISGIAAWVIGPTKGLMVAADDKSLPSCLTKRNRYGVPVLVLLLQGVIFSLLSCVFIFSDSINASYWLLSELAAQLAMLVYVFMFAAFIKLKLNNPNAGASFSIPGGKTVAIFIAGLGLLTCSCTIIIGFFPPAQLPIKKTFYDGFLLLGMIIFVVFPWLLASIRELRLKRSPLPSI